MIQQQKKAAVPVSSSRSLLLTAGFALLVLLTYLLHPSVQLSGLIISLLFTLLWFGLIGLSLHFGQWIPLLLGSLYLLGTSALQLYAENVLSSENGPLGFVQSILDYSNRALNGFAYLFDALPGILMTILTLVTLLSLIIVLDRSKPKIIEDTDSIEW